MKGRAHNFKDLTGKKFCRLLVLKFKGINKNRKSLWLCRCDCGNTTIIQTCNLTSGNTKSCGCLKKEQINKTCKINLINKRFGKWTVIKESENIGSKKKCLCLCDCGTIRKVSINNLIQGLSTNCGCVRKEIIGKINKNKELSEETKRKLSKAAKSRYKTKEDHPNFGRKLTLKSKQKISMTLKKKYAVETHPNFGKPGKAGKDNPNWNYNLTDEDRQHTRTYPEYKKWRNNIYKRDNYCCQVCNDSKGGNLVAHHIESYSSNKELRITLSNGITLCETCHLNFHHQYGYGNNTKEQFETFLKQNKPI